MVKKKGDNKISGIFTTFLMMLIGIALGPTIGSSVATAAENATGTALAMLQLVPVFWYILVVAIGVSAIVVQFRSLG